MGLNVTGDGFKCDWQWIQVGLAMDLNVISNGFECDWYAVITGWLGTDYVQLLFCHGSKTKTDKSLVGGSHHEGLRQTLSTGLRHPSFNHCHI